MRTTSQSPAGAPDQAPAGTVTVVVLLVERSAMVWPACEFFSTYG